MANYRRNRTRGHNPHAAFQIQQARAEARGEKFEPVEPLPEGYHPTEPFAVVAPGVKPARTAAKKPARKGGK